MTEQEFKVVLENNERTPCEVWTRVMGYHRPVSEFNPGKRSEYKERTMFVERQDEELAALVGEVLGATRDDSSS